MKLKKSYPELLGFGKTSEPSKKKLNPLIKAGLFVILFRIFGIFFYYLDSDIVSTPAHLIPMALFTHLTLPLGIIILISFIPHHKPFKIIFGFIAILIFILFTLVGEIHFHLERLSGQPFYWNIIEPYLHSGILFNNDVLGPLKDSLVSVLLGSFFIIFACFYSIKQLYIFINNTTENYNNLTLKTSSVTFILVMLSIYGPGSKHAAIFVVYPPEWNLYEEVMKKSITFTPLEEEQLKTSLRQLTGDNKRAKWVGDDYPLMRYPDKDQFVSIEENPDIFIIVVESLRGQEVTKILSDNQSLNPYKNLKKLADRGIYFKNFYSSGYPTTNGIFAFHTSTIPHLHTYNIVHAQDVQFDSLIHRIKKQGYHALSFWGGNPGHVNELKWARRWFDEFDFVSPGDYLRQILNRSDAEVYRQLIERVKKFDQENINKPLLAYIFTGMTHKPFEAELAYFSSPEQKNESIEISKNARTIDEKYQATLKILDLQIGKLLSLIDSRDKKDNTLIMFLGDHSANTSRSIPPQLSGFPIDDLIWTGAILAGPKSILGANIPRIENFIASQSDLIPTFINILNDPDPYTAFGSSLISDIPDLERNSIAIGPSGIRLNHGNSSHYISKHDTQNRWTSLNKAVKHDFAKTELSDQEAVSIKNSLLYWSSLVDQNRVWNKQF